MSDVGSQVARGTQKTKVVISAVNQAVLEALPGSVGAAAVRSQTDALGDWGRRLHQVFQVVLQTLGTGKGRRPHTLPTTSLQ